MFEFLQLMSVVLMGVLILFGGKQWLDNKFLEKLTDEQKDQFKKIDGVSKEVDKMKPDDVVDYWNDKDPNKK